MNESVKKAIEFLAGLGVIVPEEKHEKFAQDFFKQFKHASEMDAKIETANAEITRINGLLETANAEIQSFKEVDIDGIQAKITQYESDIAAKDAAHAKELENLTFESWKNEQLSSTGAKSTKAYGALFDWDALKSSNNRDADFKAAHETTKAENAYMFPDENPHKKLDLPPPGDFGKPITKEALQKMTYTEKYEFKSNNPDLYSAIMKG